MHSKISAADDVNVDVSNFISLTEKTEIFGGAFLVEHVTQKVTGRGAERAWGKVM